MKKALHAILMIVALLLPSSAMAYYCEPTKSGTGSHSNRYTTSIDVADGTHTSLNVPGRNSGNGGGYQDHSDLEFETEVGKTITVTTHGNDKGEWMHAFMYVDWNNDEVFNVDLNATATGVTKNPGNELLWWQYINVNGRDYLGNGSVSAGTNEEKYFKPYNGTTITFTVPNVAPGTYRARFKIDWASTDPCGTSNDFTNNCGQAIDFTIKVVATPHTVTVPEVATDAHYTLTVVAGEETLIPGTHSILSGTQVTITVTPDAGYELSSLKINGTTPVTNDEAFLLNTNINSINVEVGTPTTVTFAQPQHGTLAITRNGAAVTNGATVLSGNELVVTVTPESNYELFAIKANGTKVASTSPFTYTVPENLTSVEFTAEIIPNYASSITYSRDNDVDEATANDHFSKSYVATATTTGAVVDLAYSATARPANTLYNQNGGSVLMDSQITAERGSNFTLNLNAHSEGPSSTTDVYQDLRYTYCMIYADWNADGTFEYVTRVGKRDNEGESSGWGGNIKANYDFVMTIAQQLAVPADAANTARIRLIYQNAWKPVPTSAYNLAIHDGIAYDIVVNVVNPSYTISISAEDHGSVAFQGETAASAASKNINAGQEVTVVATAEQYYQFEGWYEGDSDTRIDGAGFEYTFEVNSDRTLVAKFQRDITTYPITINMSYAATYYADVYVYDMPINADGTVPEGATLYAKKEAWDDPIYYHEAPEGQELYVYVKQELQNINGNQAFVRLSSMEITNDGVSTGESLREGYGTGTSSHGKYCFTVGETAGDIVITGRFDDKLAYIRSITLAYKDPATMSYMGTIGMYVAGQPEGINQTKFATGAVVTLKAQAEPGASFVRWVDVDGVTTLSTSPEYEYGNDVPGDLTILAEFGPNLTINVGGNGGVSNDDNLGYVEIWDAPMEVYALKYGQNTAGSKTPILAGHAPAGATCYGIAGKFPEGYKVPTGMTLPGNDAEGHPILGYDGAVPMGKQLYVYVFSNFDDPERTYAALNGWQILDQLVVRNNDVEADLNKKALNAERPGTSTEQNYTYTQSVLEGNAELGYPALGTPYMYTYLAADGHYCYPLNDVVNGEVQITALFDTDGDLSGIDNIESAEADGNVEVYTLQGVRVAADNLTPGFYIVRQGGKATKILVK